MAAKISGLTVQIGGDTTKLDKALKEINNEAMSLQQELKKVEKALKLDPENAVLLQQKQELLNRSIENTTYKLKALEQAQEQVNRKFANGEITIAQLRDYEYRVETTRIKLKNLQKQSDEMKNSADKMRESLTDSGKAGKKMGSDIASGAQQAENEIKDVSQSTAKLENQFKTLIKAVASGYTGKKLIDYFIGSNMKMEQYITSFTTMLGSAEKAKALMDDINEMAAKTPFETTDLTKAAQMLMNYGVAEDEVINKMTQLGDLSGGVAEKLDRISLAYGQMLAKGKVTGEELRQMTEAGVTLLQPLADELGVTTAELQKMVSAGKVGIPELNAAIEKITSEGGKFSGMMENQAQTMSGMLSTLKDEFTQFGREAGEKAFGEVKGALQEVMATIEQASSDGTLDEMAEELGNALNVLVTSLMNVAKFLWEYRDAVAAGAAAMVTFNALMKISNLVRDLSMSYKVLTGSLEAVTAAQTATNVAMAANPVGLVISAVGALIAILGTLAATADSAHDKTMAAISEYENIKTEVEDLNEELKQNKLRIIEIQKQGPISPIDQSEIEKLQAMNAELDETIKRKEKLMETERKEADKTAVKEMGGKKGIQKLEEDFEYYKWLKEKTQKTIEAYKKDESEYGTDNSVEIEAAQALLDKAESNLVNKLDELAISRDALLQEGKRSKELATEFDSLQTEILNEFDDGMQEIADKSREYGSSVIDSMSKQSFAIPHKDMLEQALNDLKDQRTLGLIEDREYYRKAEELLIQHDNDMYGENKELWGEVNKFNKQESQSLLDEQKKANEKVKNEQEKAAKASADAWKKEFDVVIESGKKAAEEVIRQQDELENSFAEM